MSQAAGRQGGAAHAARSAVVTRAARTKYKSRAQAAAERQPAQKDGQPIKLLPMAVPMLAALLVSAVVTMVSLLPHHNSSMLPIPVLRLRFQSAMHACAADHPTFW